MYRGHDFIPERDLQRGNCAWIFSSDKFVEWRDPKGSPLLWIFGDPGVGKTTLACAISKSFQTDQRAGEIVVPYFCDGRYKTSNSILGILRTILDKLEERDGARKQFAREMRRSLAEFIDSSDVTRRLTWSVLEDSFTAIKHEIRSDETLILILDGLDEVENTQHDLVYGLIGWATPYVPKHRIKSIISSRPTFPPLQQCQGALRVEMTLRISAWNNSDIFSLQGTYQDMLGCVSENDRPVALLMLKWVTYAARPLFVSELIDVLNSQMSIRLTELDIGAKSGYLLTTSKDQTVNFVHLAAREYLRSSLDRGVNGIPGWDLEMREANEMLAYTCLRALRSEHLLQSLNLPKGNLHPSHCASERLQNFQDYALRYWKFHYRLAEHRSNYLPGLLHGILENVLQGKISEHREDYLHATYKSRGVLSDFSFYSESTLQHLNTALRAGTIFGFVKLVQLELEMGADGHIVPGYHKETALHLAARGGYLEVVRLLLQRGADVDARSNSGKTPLFYAIANGHTELIKLLLANSANSERRDNLKTVSRCVYLTTKYSTQCTDCGEIRAHYVLSRISSGEEDQKWQPIDVIGDPVSLTEPIVPGSAQLNAEHGDDLFIPFITEQRAVVKWFTGVDMYEALGIAARRGMDDIIKLLLVAGNDTKFLKRNISLGKLMSNMRIV